MPHKPGSLRDIAAQLGISHMTAKKALIERRITLNAEGRVITYTEAKNGAPVNPHSIKNIAERLGISREQARRAWEQGRLRVDADGNVLSYTPTTRARNTKLGHRVGSIRSAAAQLGISKDVARLAVKTNRLVMNEAGQVVSYTPAQRGGYREPKPKVQDDYEW